jgi:hypothetical protein
LNSVDFNIIQRYKKAIKLRTLHAENYGNKLNVCA